MPVSDDDDGVRCRPDKRGDAVGLMTKNQVRYNGVLEVGYSVSSCVCYTSPAALHHSAVQCEDCYYYCFFNLAHRLPVV